MFHGQTHTFSSDSPVHEVQTAICSTPSALDATQHKNSENKGEKRNSLLNKSITFCQIKSRSSIKKICVAVKVVYDVFTVSHVTFPTCPTRPKARSKLWESVYFLILLWSQPSSASLLLVSLRDLHSGTYKAKNTVNNMFMINDYILMDYKKNNWLYL